MHSHGARRGFGPDRVGGAKARDVLGHRPLEQLHVLGQVAQVAAELVFVPAVDVGAVQAHRTAQRRPQPHELPCERGLATGRRADHRQHVAGAERESDSLQNRRACAGRAGDELLDLQLPARRGQGHCRAALRNVLQQLAQPRPGIAHMDHALPLRHGLEQGREHAPAQNRADDHHPFAAIEPVVQQQPAAQTQQQRAQGVLQQLAQRLEAARAFRRRCLQTQDGALRFLPAALQMAQHSHGFDDLGIAQTVVGILLGRDGLAVGLREQRPGASLVGPGDRDLQGREHYGRPTQDRTDEKQQQHHHQRDRRFHPGQQRGRVEEIANELEVMERLRRAPGDLLQACRKDGVEDAFTELCIEAYACRAHDFAARPFEHFHQCVGAEHGEGQHQQGDMVAAVDHPVVDLEHVDRRREHEQARQQAEATRAQKIRSERNQGLVQFAGSGIGIHGQRLADLKPTMRAASKAARIRADGQTRARCHARCVRPALSTRADICLLSPCCRRRRWGRPC